MSAKISDLSKVRAQLDAEAQHLTDSAEMGNPAAVPAGARGVEVLAGTSDDALALRFTERHKDDLRHVAAWGKWLIWDGMRWAVDEKLGIYYMARKLCRDVLNERLSDPALAEPQKRQLRDRLGAAQTIAAVIKLASSDPLHAVTVDQLDADLWALNTPGGILDLRNGRLRPHDPSALCTKMTAAAPGGECPKFMETLERVQPAADVRAYLQRLAGYAMTGSSREHVLPFWHGGGGNGKGTIAHSIRRALGDYAIEIDPAMLMESRNERHPTELARLCGARFVVGSEIDGGCRWNESRIKRLTGGDPIRARFMHKDDFEFEPTHTLIVFANRKPALRSVDEAIRRRMHLVPWDVTIPPGEQDPTLKDQIAANELGGILAWMLRGCLEWQHQGLAPPQSVRAATEQYLSGEDNVAQWIEERCQRNGQCKVSIARRDFTEWCQQNHVPPLSRSEFVEALQDHGFTVRKDAHAKQDVIEGLELQRVLSGRDRAAGLDKPENDSF